MTLELRIEGDPYAEGQSSALSDLSVRTDARSGAVYSLNH